MHHSMKKLFDQGYDDRVNAESPLSAFEMSMKMPEYVAGYIDGHAFVQSVRNASAMVWAWEVGTLGREYGLPLERLERLVGRDEDDADVLLEAIRQTYREEDGDAGAYDDDACCDGV